MNRWIVRIGDLYLGGLGVSFTNSACVGFVITKLQEHAFRFSSMDSAKSVADSLGGQVIKV